MKRKNGLLCLLLVLLLTLSASCGKQDDKLVGRWIGVSDKEIQPGMDIMKPYPGLRYYEIEPQGDGKGYLLTEVSLKPPVLRNILYRFYGMRQRSGAVGDELKTTEAEIAWNITQPSGVAKGEVHDGILQAVSGLKLFSRKEGETKLRFTYLKDKDMLKLEEYCKDKLVNEVVLTRYTDEGYNKMRFELEDGVMKEFKANPQHEKLKLQIIMPYEKK